MDISALNAAAPTARAASNQASSQLSANFDTFLTLLTTQLRNQDPLSPLDTEKFTEQLVQFAGVEQSIETNRNLEALVALQSASANETALGLVGRHVSVDTKEAALGDNAPAQWRVVLPADASEAQAQIRDANGALVAALAVPAGAGPHDIRWDGTRDGAAKAPAGLYTLSLVGDGGRGETLPAEITVNGRVDAARFDSVAPQIRVGAASYDIQAVLSAAIDDQL